MPHTGQSPVFSCGLLLAGTLALLVDAVAEVLKVGNVNGVADVDDVPLLLLESNADGVLDTGGCALADCVPKLSEGSDVPLVAVDEDEDNAGVEVPKVNDGAVDAAVAAAGA